MFHRDLFTEFLRKSSPQELVDYAQKTITEEDAKRNIGLPFVPSIEKTWWPKNSNDSEAADEAFLTEDPLEIIRRGNYTKVPFMTGYTSHEAMLFIRSKTLINNLSNELQN